MFSLRIITVNYNGAAKVVNLVKKFCSEIGTECIVVDNKSIDDLSAIERLTRVSKVTLVKNPTNLGFAAGANVGIREDLKSKCSWILLVNPDVKVSGREIRRLLKNQVGDIISPVLKFKRHGKWVFDFGGRVNWILGRTIHSEFSQGDPLLRKGSPYEIDYVSGACMLIKKEVFEKIGLFDEKFFLYFEDADLCLRAKAAGFRVIVYTNVIVEHEIDEHRQTHDTFKINHALKSNLIFINKWIPWYFRPLAYIYWFLLWLKTR